MSHPPTKQDPYIAWRTPDFRCFELSWFAMTFSKQIERLAIAVYFVNLYSSSDAALALAMMGLVQAAPIMLLAIFGGQLADRFDRRRLWIDTLVVNVVVSIGLIAAVWHNSSPVWIYVLLALNATAQSVGSPSRAALLPQLVSREAFTNAVTWNSTMFYMGSVTGPAIGGAILAVWHNPASALVAVAVWRLVALLAVWRIRHRQAVGDGQEISWESVVAGIRFVWKTKLILASITLDMFAVLLGGVTYLLPIFAKDILHVGPLGLGFLQGADAIGATCMAVMLVHLPPMRRAGVTLLWAVAGFGLATILFGVSTWFWFSMAMMFLVGALDNISVVVRHTLVQMLTPDEMRGRVSAVNNVFIVASNDLGGLESGLTTWLFGSAMLSAVFGGVGTMLVVVTVACLWPEILRIGSLQSICPVMIESEDETPNL
ncbi:MAG: MFS transporter [Planctomycetaceae bacterium]|nr:MFS transporter [Planctomycetaceae bacterium]